MLFYLNELMIKYRFFLNTFHLAILLVFIIASCFLVACSEDTPKYLSPHLYKEMRDTAFECFNKKLYFEDKRAISPQVFIDALTGEKKYPTYFYHSVALC